MASLIVLGRWALDWAITRRFIADRITGALHGAIGGASLEVAEIEHLGWGELSGAELVLRDAAGAERGRAVDIRGTFSVWPLLGSLLFGGSITIRVHSARAQRVDVDLELHDGTLMIGGPDVQPPPEPDRPGRGFRLTFDDLFIDAGSLDVATDAGPVSASLRDLDAALVIASDEIAATLRSAPLSVSSPLGAVSVHAFGRIRHDRPGGETEGALLVVSELDGAVATTAMSWQGGGFDLFTATDIPFDRLRERFEGWPEAARGRLVARIEHEPRAPPGVVEIYLWAPLDTAELTFDGSFDAAARRLVGALSASESQAARWWNGDQDASVALSASLDASTEPPEVAVRIDELDIRVDETRARALQGSVFANVEGATASLEWPSLGVTGSGRYDHDRRRVDARLSLDTRGRAFWRETARWISAARATAEATIDLRSRRLTSELHASARRIAVGGVAAHRMRLDGRATGPLAAPRIALRGTAARFSAGAVGGALTVRAEGRIPDFEASVGLAGELGALDVTTRASCDGDRCAFSDVMLSLERAGRRVTAVVERLSVDAERAVLSGATVRGLGEPIRAEASLAAETQRLSLEAPAVAVSDIGWWLRRPRRWRGTLATTIELEVQRQSAFGRVSGALHDVVVGASPPVDARFHVDVDGSRVDGSLKARAGSSHLTADLSHVVLAGDPLAGGAWLDASGEAEAELYASQRLLCALSELTASPTATRVSEHLAGVAARVSLRRSSGDAAPELDALWQVSSTGHLSESGSWEPRRPYTMRGFVETRKQGDAATLAASASVTWQHTRLLAAAGEIALPSSALGSRDAWERAPLRASLWVPPRAISGLPHAHELAGRVEALANVGGTALEPVFSVAVDTSGLRLGGYELGRLALSGRHAAGRASLWAVGREGATIRGVGHLELDVAAAELLTPAAWRGDAHVSLLGWPIVVGHADQALTASARLSGQLAWLGRGATPTVAAQLAATHLVVAGQHFRGAMVSATVSERAARLDATIEQDRRSSGKLSVRAARAPGDGPLPRLERPVSLRLEARDLRMLALAPLVSPAVRTLDGRLNADASLELGEKESAARGIIAIDHGRLQLRGLSTPWQDVTLRARFDEERVVVDTFSAESWGGALSARGAVDLDRGRFAGAEGEIVVPKKTPIPIIVDGNRLADVSGKLALSADGSRRPIDVRVRASDVEVELPALAKKDLQSLDDDPHIAIVGGPRRAEEQGERDRAPSSSRSPLARLDLRTVDDVVVTQGESLEVTLVGGATAVASDAPTIEGQLRLTGGQVEVQGKRFNIDSGTITFRPEAPSDPVLTATASWIADDGTVIYADYVGPLSAGEVSLRSDPPLSRGQVLATLILGSAERPANQYTGTAAAAGLGGGIAADPLNTILRKVSRLDITAGVETGLAAAPAPAIEWRIAREFSVQFAHVLGLPVPGENPDRNLTTLTWRFFRRWSLEATIGDRGSSILDLLWQKSY